jgi:hypothetical protein
MTQISRIAAAAAMLAFSSAAFADLNRVGPTNNPAPPGNGFPFWYQDLNGTVLDLCIPTATATQDPSGLQETACLLGPPAPPLPYTFPTSFPDEVFYHRVVSDPLTTSPSGQKAVLVLALEAAFASGGPAAGQQMVFARIRVTAGVPVSGTYTVTHPYGTETFTDVIASGGNRDIIFTEDVGLTPLNFTDALTSRVGPFLQHSDIAPGGPAAAPLVLPFVTNPDGTTSAAPGARLFLGDGVTGRFITGSPFGTNYFEICGPFNGTNNPDACVRQDLFTVVGMLHDPNTPVGSPLSVTRATFNRTNGASQVDVMARASSGPGQAAPKLSAAGNAVSPVLMAGPTVLGDWYAQGIPVPSTDVPTQITVTNSSDVPPTSIESHVTDEITIKSVVYQGGTITVVATSSDKGDSTVTPAIPPAGLSLAGFPNAIRTPSSATDPAEVTFAAAVTPTATGALVPPAFVRVVSNMGGLASADTSLGVADPAFPAGVPFASNEAADFVQDPSGLLPSVGIDVLANDVAPASAPIQSGTLAIVPPLPSIGVASVSAGRIFYKVPAVTGSTTIRYTVNNAVGTSNVGTVFVTVAADPTGPVPTANNDPNAGGAINVTAGSSVTVNVLANDTTNDPTGTIQLDPSSVVITSPPATGTATVDAATGAITYSAPAGSSGIVTLQYRVSTLANGTTAAKQSNVATVTITVTGAELLTVQTPIKCDTRGKWQVRGTSNVSTNNVITIYQGATITGNVIGTAAVVNGAWQYQGTGGNTCTSPISLRSSLGTTLLNRTVQIK